MKRKLGFFGRQLLAYAVALTVFSLVLVALVYNYMTKTSLENAAITQQQLTDSTLEQVNNYFDSMMLLAAQISHDSEVVQILSHRWFHPLEFGENYFRQESPEKDRLLEILENHNRGKTPAQRIFVFNWNGDFLCTDPTDEKLVAGTEAYPMSYRGLIPFVFSDPYRDHLLLYPVGDPLNPEDTGTYNYLIMPIRNVEGTEIVAYVAIMQPAQELYALLEMDERTGIDAYLVDYFMGERIIQHYPSHDWNDDDDSQYYGNVSTDKDNYITEAKTDYAWTVALVQNQNHLLTPYRTAVLYLLLGVMALVIVLFLCVYLIAKHTNKPVLQLSSKVKALKLDSFSKQPITTDATDEVRELDHAIDTMVERIRSSVELEKSAYLKALQAQMNPHFLYNCLSTISGMCIIGRTEKIPKFCSRLAATLRYETNYTEKGTTLKDELDSVSNYLELMKLRYDNDFAYELHADEALLGLPMPRLLLQPIVENCFEHGFRDVAPPWRISIAAFREENRWCITVTDNGCGMDEATRQEILRQVDALAQTPGSYSELQIGGLGLVNTILRLRLLTDDSLIYTITSGTPNGTIVTLKGTISNESSDRGR